MKITFLIGVFSVVALTPMSMADLVVENELPAQVNSSDMNWLVHRILSDGEVGQTSRGYFYELEGQEGGTAVDLILNVKSNLEDEDKLKLIKPWFKERFIALDIGYSYQKQAGPIVLRYKWDYLLSMDGQIQKVRLTVSAVTVGKSNDVTISEPQERIISREIVPVGDRKVMESWNEMMLELKKLYHSHHLENSKALSI